MKTPKNREKKCTNKKVVCKLNPTKGDTNRINITVGGNIICHPGDIETPTISLETRNIPFNIIFYRLGVKISTLNIKNFYLNSTIGQYKYACIYITNIPDESVQE